jgi:CheY-like chemotaxis protein/anti-sigma regulatory factor (Ser/Thr protein kinase)
MVMGDPMRLNQIMTNLVSNAIKFTPKGKVTIKVSLERIEEERVVIDFAVQDTGVGIKEDKLEKIFDSFTQASSDTTRNFGGSGLGLAITKRLLELQNSNIHVQSSLGVGSRFYFTLSFPRSGKGLILKDRQLSEAFIKEHKQSLVGYKVLVVEDNLINQVIASKFLLRWGLQIDMADNGLIALERVKAADYDLILMDLEMPEMDGYSATKAIRSLAGEKYKSIPIIALTASAFMEVQQEVYAAGMNGYLTKPFNPDEMLEVLTQNLLSKAI